MPIVTLQRQAAELGRIRLGVRLATTGGKTRPAKLDTFRFTSPSRALIERAAALYGGSVGPWSAQPDGPPQWETISTATELPILVPPQPLSQWFESWSAGGCTRRCDGRTEVLSDSPCMCDPDPLRRACKATTRLRVVLRDMPGVGVWRLESHGYYAAVELPALAEFLADSDGYIAALLTVRERVAMRGGKTLRYLVPGIEIDATPAELMSGAGAGAGARAVLSQDVAAVESSPLALESATPQEVSPDVPDRAAELAAYLDTVAAVADMPMLTEVYHAARADGFCPDVDDPNDPLAVAFVAAKTRLRPPRADVPEGAAPNGPVPNGAESKRAVRAATSLDQYRAKEVVELPAPGEAVPAADDAGDVDALWYSILGNADEDWSTEQVEADFTTVTGVEPKAASAADMRRYLASRKGA